MAKRKERPVLYDPESTERWNEKVEKEHNRARREGRLACVDLLKPGPFGTYVPPAGPGPDIKGVDWARISRSFA